MFLETLEGRRLYAVTVVQGLPGFFEIYGDEKDNEITVDVGGDGSFSIAGKTFQAAEQIAVYGRAGNDLIMVSAPPGSPVEVSIDGGEGDDILALNVNGAAWGGPGNDRIYLFDSMRGQAFGGDGDDYIWVGGDNVDPYIDGGEGDDWIDASTNNFRVSIHGGGGNDVIFGSNYDDHLFGDAGNDALYGNGGNDTIFIRDGSYDCADGGGDPGDICYADRNAGFEDGISGFAIVYYG